MKQNKIFSIVVITISSIILWGCNKKTDDSSKPKDATQVLTELISSKQVCDMNISVSTSYGNSPYPNGNGQPWTILLGYHRNFVNAGSLAINSTALPYSSNQYYKQTDANLSSNLFTGLNAGITFVTSDANLMPSFQTSLYSPSSTPLTFTGLTDYKLNRGNNLTISWVPDEGYNNTSSAGKSYLVVQGENDNNREDRSAVFVKELQDNLGSFTLSSSDLAQFDSYSSITIVYGKGCYNVQNISNKSAMFQFQNFSYSNIYFN